MSRSIKKLSRSAALATACALAGSLLLPAGVAAASEANIVPSGTSPTAAATAVSGSQISTVSQQEQELAEELRFLFEESSSVDEAGNITLDYASLEARYGGEAPNLVFFIYASQGKTYEEAAAALPAGVSPPAPPMNGGSGITPQNAYTDCILDKSGFASLTAVFSGAMAGYLAEGSYDKAGKIIFKAAVKNGMKVTIPGIIVTLGASATWCAFTS